MECIGCFIFIYTICMAVQNNQDGLAPIGIGGCLMVLIYMGGAVSGGHFNPAVSLGIFIRDDDFSLVTMLLYMLAQFVGGIAGGMTAYAVFKEEDEKWKAAIVPGGEYNDGDAF